jgi:hypothetical protein
MNQAEEDGEVGEEVFVEHAFEIKFDEALADEAGGVAQEPQDASVGGDAVEVFGEVEVFLHEGVGRHAGPGAVVAAFVEAVVPAEQVQREAVARFVAVGDGKALAVDVLAFAAVGGAVAKERKQRDEPEVAGLGGQGGR